MSAVLSVETADLAEAARVLSVEVADQLWSSVGSAVGEAAACRGMAGDDPAGLAWGEQYEAAATAAARGAQDVINGAFALSALLLATADNYARADEASTAGGRGEAVSDAPSASAITLATRFAGVGGGPPNAPWGWSYVQHYVRLAWPNGHQDRLTAAAQAWRRSAAALSGHAMDVELAALPALRDGLPEWRDIRTACLSLAGQLRAVAQAHRGLAGSCEAFAHHLDVAHSSLEHEVEVFVIESAAIQGAGSVLAYVTAGLSELAAEGVEGARVAATVARIVTLAGEFANGVRELVTALPLVTETVELVSSSLDRLLSVRVVVAEVSGVPGLRVLTIARDGRTLGSAADAGGELGAVTRLADDANLPTELRTALDSPRTGEWNEPGLLKAHFNSHASDFGATSQPEYEAHAREFFRRGIDDQVEVKIDESTGDIRMYDSETNTFGSYTSDGTIRTFFKPTSPKYWAKQKGDVVTW